MTPARITVTAEGVAPPIGPYRHAVRFGDLLFCAGQVGAGEDGALVAGDPGDQARRALENLQRVCRAAGGELASAVRVGIFLQDFADFAAVNEAYEAFFDTEPPARTTVQVAGLPLGALVEIDAIVALGA